MCRAALELTRTMCRTYTQERCIDYLFERKARRR